MVRREDPDLGGGRLRFIISGEDPVVALQEEEEEAQEHNDVGEGMTP